MQSKVNLYMMDDREREKMDIGQTGRSHGIISEGTEKPFTQLPSHHPHLSLVVGVAVLVLVVPLVEVDVEDDDCTRIQTTHDETVIRRHRHATHRRVGLLQGHRLIIRRRATHGRTALTTHERVCLSKSAECIIK